MEIIAISLFSLMPSLLFFPAVIALGIAIYRHPKIRRIAIIIYTILLIVWILTLVFFMEA